VRVLLKDAQGQTTTVAQALETKLVLDVNDPPSGNSIVIFPLPGERVAGATLSFTDHLFDPDGRGAVAWQWLANGQAIAGATGTQYTLTPADLGKDIAVMASYTDGKGVASEWRSDGVVRPNLDGIVRFSGEAGPNAVVRVEVDDPDFPRDIHYLWDVRDAQGNWTRAPGVIGKELRLGEGGASAAHVLLAYADDGGKVEQHGAIIGTGGADDLAAEADWVYAGGGNDTIRWSGAVYTQRVDGGAGIDLFAAPQAAYHVQQSAGDPRTWWLADGLARGQTLLTQVERLQLGSKFLALDTLGAGGQAYRLYQAAFDRAPDSFGLGFWISRLDLGVSLKTVAKAFVSSAEFRTLYGEQPGNAELVTRFYTNVLGRAPDAASSFWVDVLDRKLASVAEVLVGFSESAENVAALTGVMQHGMEYLPYH
jgi:hypothetical protein